MCLIARCAIATCPIVLCANEGFSGDQVFPLDTLRSTRSAGKVAAVNKHGRSSRTDPYGFAKTKIGNPRVHLTKVESVDYKVDKQGSTFKISLEADGEYLHKEIVHFRPGTSGLGSPLIPAADENPGKASPSSAARPMSTEDRRTVGPQEEEVECDRDSLDGCDVGEDDGTGDPSVEEKRKRGRPPTTWEHVGKRKKDEERARARKVAEKERLAAESLKAVVPKSRKWERLQEEEEELEARLIESPTSDIASRLMEHSVTVFNIAECSNGMHGSLVKKLQDTAILMRAATNVMAIRARKAQGEGDIRQLSREMEEMRAENNRLRGEMDRLKAYLPPPTVPTPAPRRTRSGKRRRMLVSSSDSGEETEVMEPETVQSLPPPRDDRNFPSLSYGRRGRMGRRDEETAPRKEEGAYFTGGLTLQGRARKLEAYPPGLPKEHRTEHDALLGDLAPCLEEMNLQEDTQGPEYGRLWEQANAIKSKLCSLRGEVFVPPPMPLTSASYGFGPSRTGKATSAQLTADQYVSPSVIDQEATAFRSQRGDTQMQKEAGPPLPARPTAPPIAALAGKKKKKKGRKGKTPPPASRPTSEPGGSK